MLYSFVLWTLLLAFLPCGGSLQWPNFRDVFDLAGEDMLDGGVVMVDVDAVDEDIAEGLEKSNGGLVVRVWSSMNCRVDRLPVSEGVFVFLVNDCARELSSDARWILSQQVLLQRSESLPRLILLLRDQRSLDCVHCLPLRINSEVYVMAPSNNTSHEIEMYEAYKVNENDTSAKLNLLGTSLNRTHPMASVPIWERRKDLSGRLLRVGFDFYFPPFSHVVDGLPAGFFGKLLLELASPHMLNFSYELVKSVDGLYGSLTEDGHSYDGLVGMIQRREIDIIASELSISDMRARIVDFISPVWTSVHKVVMKRPGQGLDWGLYVRVFSMEFWLVVLFAMIVLSVALFFTSGHGRPEEAVVGDIEKAGAQIPAVELRRKAGSNVVFEGVTVFGDFFCFITCCFATKEVGKAFLVPSAMPNGSSRTVIITALIAGFVVFSSYNAVLTSYLAVRNVELPIKKIEDILHTNLKIAMKRGSFYMDLFRQSPPGSPLNEIYERKIRADPRSVYNSTLDSVFSSMPPDRKQLLEDGYILIFDTAYLSNYDEYPCWFIDIQEKLISSSSTMALQKNSSFLDLFNYHVAKLREQGSIDRWKRKLLKPLHARRRDHMCNVEDNGASTLGFSTTVLPFAAVAVGLALAVLICAGECAAAMWRRRGQSEQENILDVKPRLIDSAKGSQYYVA